jgi:hypothetical protein
VVQTMFTFCKISYLNEEVKRTEPSHSVRLPGVTVIKGNSVVAFGQDEYILIIG